MSDYYAQFDAAAKAFDDDSLASLDDITLRRHLIALANEPVPNRSVQHRNIIRGLTINHVLLQRYVDRLNKQNQRTQLLVIVLTVASLVGTLAQVWYAHKAEKNAKDVTSVVTSPDQRVGLSIQVSSMKFSI